MQEVVPINTERTNAQATQLTEALAAGASSTRLKAALTIGTDADPAVLEALVARCAIEPDFYVRDMLTWALTRLPADLTVPRLLAELDSDRSQARSQALHTLSKIGDLRAWPAMTPALIRDPDDEVARAAWRAAVAVVPEDQMRDLAEELAAQLGRGEREVQLSLSRAMIELGTVIEPILQRASTSDDPVVAAHAAATERLLEDPDASFEPAVKAAKRIFALGGERS
ncbi:HEAT repeat domain-containing protein [Glycomyces sp. YM15]|uniref:HEAT repeat domain-containing protein n=1 Tax=Glycomyces sp. YM15 TaxID=2800446 RepID=UPI001F051F9E|nr:HEAT repeat domain-containing protein [Glycomyces sp. YM15]